MKQFYERLLRLIVWLCEQAFGLPDLPEEEEPPRVIFSRVRIDGITIRGDIKMLKLRKFQQVELTAEPVDKDGDEAVYQEGSARWESSNPEVLSVEQDADDELVAVCKGLRAGVAQVTCKIDGDPDEDERELIGFENFEVTGAEATAFRLEAGSVTDTPQETSGGGETAPTTEEPTTGGGETTTEEPTTGGGETTTEEPAPEPAPSEETPTSELPSTDTGTETGSSETPNENPFS